MRAVRLEAASQAYTIASWVGQLQGEMVTKSQKMHDLRAYMPSCFEAHSRAPVEAAAEATVALGKSCRAQSPGRAFTSP